MDAEQIASKCHDIQTTLGNKEVPEFEFLPKVGMMVNLALHIRGLPVLAYEKLKLVASYYFGIPSGMFKEVIIQLAEIEFVKLGTEGSSIKTVVPQVPFFESIYNTIGQFAKVKDDFNEPETLALKIVSKLSDSPTERSNLFTLGAESRIVERSLDIGTQGGYIVTKRARGKDILISPLFFAENADVFADLAAKTGARNIQHVLSLIKNGQGWPLSVIENELKIAGKSITDEEFKIIKRLAQDGMVKPPSITTPHSGSNFFIFTPAPGTSKLTPTNKEIYERAMALISSVRQGQFLAQKYRILYPDKILRALKRNGSLNPTSETYSQYHQLAMMKIGRLVKSSESRYRFVLNDAEENIKALDLAIELLEKGTISNMEVNDEARIALQKDQTYIESLVGSSQLRAQEKVTLDEESKAEFDNLLLKGISI